MHTNKHALAATMPTARAEDLIVETVGEEMVVFDRSTKGAHCLSPLAAVVFASCDGKTTTAEVAALAEERLGEPVSEQAIVDAVAQLDTAGLLEKQLRVLSDQSAQGDVSRDDASASDVSRREAMRKFALAGAAVAGATPLITSIVSPSLALAAPSGNGCTCTSNAGCTYGSACCLPGTTTSCPSPQSVKFGCCVPSTMLKEDCAATTIFQCAGPGGGGSFCSYNKSCPSSPGHIVCSSGSCACCSSGGNSGGGFLCSNYPGSTCTTCDVYTGGDATKGCCTNCAGT